jgi:hypothetical protein
VVGETLMEAVVSPLDHEYALPPIPVNVAEVPEQIVGELTVMDGVELTVTVDTAVLLHPAASTPVTVYEVVASGKTVTGLPD